MADVFCNTSPLQYLYQLDELELLRVLAPEIQVPDMLVEELDVGRMLGVQLPKLQDYPWIKVRNPVSGAALKLVSDLGPGETAVLILGLENPHATLLLDDMEARRFAESNGLKFTGTLGVLIAARRAGLIPHLKTRLDLLDRLGFRLSRNAREAVLASVGE